MILDSVLLLGLFARCDAGTMPREFPDCSPQVESAVDTSLVPGPNQIAPAPGSYNCNWNGDVMGSRSGVATIHDPNTTGSYGATGGQGGPVGMGLQAPPPVYNLANDWKLQFYDDNTCKASSPSGQVTGGTYSSS